MQPFLDRMDMRGALALIMVTSVMSMMFVLGITQPNSDIFKILMGTIVGTAFGSAMGFYFNSSSGSAMKDEALAKTATVANQTIADQSAALAQSVPATSTTTSVDAKAGTAETKTEPAAPETKP